MISIGSKVTVYEDPITQQKSEGEAFIRELLRLTSGGGIFRVEFVDEPGVFYERTVITDAKIEIEASLDSCGRWKD